MAEVIQTNIGKNVSDLSKNPQPKPYSKVVLIVDENTTYTAGSDNGLALQVECPWGSQAVANALLRQINGWTYRPYEASGALLNPAIEIGDGVVIDDNELDIWKRNVDFGALTTAELSAPTDEEVDHEYPWVSEQQRQTDRKFVVVNDTIQANYSEFKTTASEISASVTAVETNKLDHTSSTQTMSWSLTSDGFYINNSDTADDNHFKFKVDADGAEVNGTIRATAGEIGSFYIGSADLHTRLKVGDEYVERTDHSSATRGIRINSSGISMGDGTERTFYVSNTGNLTAKRGTFGSLTVNEGKTMGGFYGGLNGCTGSVSNLGGYISSSIGVGNAAYGLGAYIKDLVVGNLTVTGWLQGKTISTDGLGANNISVNENLLTTNLSATNELTFKQQVTTWKSKTVVTSAWLTGQWVSSRALVGSSGYMSYSLGTNTATIYYLGHD